MHRAPTPPRVRHLLISCRHIRYILARVIREACAAAAARGHALRELQVSWDVPRGICWGAGGGKEGGDALGLAGALGALREGVWRERRLARAVFCCCCRVNACTVVETVSSRTRCFFCFCQYTVCVRAWALVPGHAVTGVTCARCLQLLLSCQRLHGGGGDCQFANALFFCIYSVCARLCQGMQ